MASPAPGPHRLGELQTCAGLGWVKFELATPEAAGLSEIPAFRCVGLRVTQELTAQPRSNDDVSDAVAASGGHPSTAASSSSAGSSPGSAKAASKGASDRLARASEQTWALICTGQLSMIVSQLDSPASLLPALASGRRGAAPALCSSASGRSSQSSDSPSWAVRCDGLSLRFEIEKMAAAAKEAKESQAACVQEAAAPQAAAQQAAPQRGVEAPQGNVAAAGPPSQSQEALGTLLSGAEAVAGRAKAIVSLFGGAPATGPVSFASDTVTHAKRICVQAGRITRRSAEQVSNIAMLPFRLRGGEGFDGGGGSSGSGDRH